MDPPGQAGRSSTRSATADFSTAATLEAFYDQLGEAGCEQLQAVSMDLGAAFKKATDTKAPQAR
ncbi:MAG: transposase, partial [Candidatus Limnocylindria bacterium]